MKIKFSKSQWEQIGKQAGWMRLAAVPIPQNDDEVYSIFVDWINRVFKTDIFIYTSTEHLDKDSCIQAIAEIIIREPRYEYIRQIIESDFSEEAKKENINETLSYIRSYRQNGHLNEDITEIKQESDLFVRQYENIFQKCLMAKNIYENIKNKGELPDANLFTFQLAGFDNYKKILPLTTGASEGIPEDLSIYKTILDKLGSNYIKLLENPRIGQILFMMTMGFGKELFGFKQTFLKLLSKTNPKTVVDFFTHRRRSF
jgi:hypothetical protein